MRIDIHIGLDASAAERMQRIFDAARDSLADQGVLYPKSLGARNHTRLFMAVSDPQAVDALRVARGHVNPEDQTALRYDLTRKLGSDIRKAKPDHVILSAHQLGTGLTQASELRRLRDLCAPLSDDIRICVQIDSPARLLARAYATQILDGRIRPLTLEQSMLEADDFRAACLASHPTPQPFRGLFAAAQGANFWLDAMALQQAWDAVFGDGATRFYTLDAEQLFGAEAGSMIAERLNIGAVFGPSEVETPPALPCDAWLARCRMMNDVLLRYMAKQGAALPRPLWRKLLGEIKLSGPSLAPGALTAVHDRFAPDLATLAQRFKTVHAADLLPDAASTPWREPDPQRGFRATQYLMAFRWRIDQALKTAREEAALDAATLPDSDGNVPVDAILSDTARADMPDLAKRTFVRLRRSAYAPHNRMGAVDESALAAPFTPARSAPDPSRVIVGCMKNEAPYILEWVAYHRAVGFGNFLIYTNDCDDGTDDILQRLQTLGLLQHRDNGTWSGKSPQQFALDQSLREPVIQTADWIAHIDVDEFVNIRCGNGHLDDLFARIPDATNIAMTWRLFGHNGVTHLDDRFVIDQFDHAAPKYCPKPHTAWGFKTLFRNIGAYGKFSCHRPNKLNAAVSQQVSWVNGSGQDMTQEALKNGWRNSRKSIGYDLVQLNHYALRSAESFLIKRQRGRALHVDRSIGLNYWIRMDWSDVRDITIQRNIPRVRVEYERLLLDPQLRALHEAGLDWHREKAADLRQDAEFEALYQRAVSLRLTETERVAWALALDMES